MAEDQADGREQGRGTAVGTPGLGRRTLLVGTGSAVVVAGCGLVGGGSEKGPGPDDQAVQRARAGEMTLLAQYAAALARHPALVPALGGVVADHRAHLAALQPPGPAPTASASAPPPPPPPVPADSTAAVAALSRAEATAADQRASDCLAVSRHLAPLLGSLAASEASHAALLAPLVAARSAAATP